MGYCRGCMAATIAPFEARKAEVTERVRQGPAAVDGQLPTRWTLGRIRDTFTWLRDYSLSGVWRMMKRLDLGWRWSRPARFSLDPAYEEKQAHVLDCLQAAARQPDQIVLVFLDEMGFFATGMVVTIVGPKADAMGCLLRLRQVQSCPALITTDSGG